MGYVFGWIIGPLHLKGILDCAAVSCITVLIARCRFTVLLPLFECWTYSPLHQLPSWSESRHCTDWQVPRERNRGSWRSIRWRRERTWRSLFDRVGRSGTGKPIVLPGEPSIYSADMMCGGEHNSGDELANPCHHPSCAANP